MLTCKVLNSQPCDKDDEKNKSFEVSFICLMTKVAKRDFAELHFLTLDYSNIKAFK